ncbi:MAG: hypothetical protein JNK82_07595 [Myxococcaceae bacterium]|nr:hypothetical protein [Myxococcaceae bacterium]
MLLLVAVLLSQAPEKVAGATFEKTNKPSGLMPEHQRVTVPDFGKLDVVNVAAWEKLFAVEPKTKDACVTKSAADLKKALKAKGVPAANKELPTLGCLDATSYFTVQARRVKMGKAEGLLYVTQWFIEPTLTSNRELQAWFQGFTADGKTYVVGSVPVKAKGLRDDGGPLVNDTAAYQKQLDEDASMLGKLGAADFEPNLDTLAKALEKAQLP